MKKNIVLLLVLGVCLCSCGKAADTAPKEDVESSQEKETKPEKDTAEEVKNVVLPKISGEHHYLTKYMEEEEFELAHVSVDSLSLSGEGYEAAAATVRDQMGADEQELQTRLSEIEEIAMEQYQELKEYDENYSWYFPYSSSAGYAVARLDEKVLSVEADWYLYTGGAHENYGIDGYTIDLKSGEMLTMQDVVKDFPAFSEQACRIIFDRLEYAEDNFNEGYEQYIEEHLGDASWYMDGCGIEIIFQPYEIGPYAMGEIKICLPYSEIGEYLTERYLPDPDCYVNRLVMDEETTVWVDGVEKTIELKRQNGSGSELVLAYNGVENELAEDIYLKDAYLIKKPNQQTYLIYDADFASEDYVTCVYALESNGIRKTAEEYASIERLALGPDEIRLQYTKYLLGTYIGVEECTLTDDGELVQIDGIYQFHTTGQGQILTLKKAMPVMVGDSQEILNAGTKLMLDATDDNGTLWFHTVSSEDGSVSGSITYTMPEDESQLYIDGIVEDEYFEALPYTG